MTSTLNSRTLTKAGVAQYGSDDVILLAANHATTSNAGPLSSADRLIPIPPVGGTHV